MALIDLKSNLSWYAQFPIGNRVNAELSGFNGFRQGTGTPVQSRFTLNDNLTINVGMGGFDNNGFFMPPRPVTNELRVTAGGETAPVTVFSRKNQLGVQGSILDGLLGYQFERSGKKRTGFFRVSPSSDTTYGSQFNSLDTVGLADTMLNRQNVATTGQTPFKSSPIDQQYNKFNIQAEAHDPFELGIRSVTQLSGIQRRGVIETSTFGLGDDSTSVVPELTDYPIGGFNTHAAYQRQSDQRRLAYKFSPKGQAAEVKTQVLKQTYFGNPLSPAGGNALDFGAERAKVSGMRKQAFSSYVAGQESDNYEINQNKLKQTETLQGTTGQNNNLVNLSGNYGTGTSDFSTFSGESGAPTDQLNFSTINNPSEPSLASLQQPVGNTRNNNSDSTLSRLYGGGSHNTSLDAQFGLGSPLENLRYSYRPNVSTSPYAGTNDPSGQKAFGGQEIIPNLEKDGVGPDTLAPPKFQKSEEREKFPKESGEQGPGQKYKTMGYNDLKSAASQRKSKTSQNYDFLKKGNYSGKEEELGNKSYDDGELARNPQYPHDQGGGSFEGGGLASSGQDMHKYGGMKYNSIPSPAKEGSRSKLSKDNKAAKQPKHGGYYGSYDKPGSAGSIGTSYSPGEGLTLRTEFSDGKANKDGKNPGDMEFKFKSVQGGDEIKFSAFLNSISENFAPSWDGQQDQGRADARYLYTSFERTVSCDFVVYCFDKANFKDMWKKLANLAKITYPMEKGSGFHGQICEVTIGKLYEGYKTIITDLSYDWDNETSWDLKEHAPMSCNVSISFTILGDQKDGKKFDKGNKIYEGLGA